MNNQFNGFNCVKYMKKTVQMMKRKLTKTEELISEEYSSMRVQMVVLTWILHGCYCSVNIVYFFSFIAVRRLLLFFPILLFSISYSLYSPSGNGKYFASPIPGKTSVGQQALLLMFIPSITLQSSVANSKSVTFKFP